MILRVFAALSGLVFCLNAVHAATVTWTNTAGGNWAAAANWSPNQIPGSADQAVITTAGNYTVGRGYEPATLSGDSGIGLTGELRGPRLMVSNRSRISLQPYVFGDAAWVWNKNDGIGAEHLKSAGGGAPAEMNDRFRLDAAVAVPLEKTGIEARKGDVRLLVTLTSRILPW